MRPPAPLALLLAPLLACFTDGGTATVATTPGGPTSEPGTQTTQADTGTDGESSTGAPTTGTPTTASPTTAPSTTDTSTTDASTTGSVGNCELAPECQAGAVETGEYCDSCGVMRRTCQADCTWTPLSCAQDLDTCSHWYLPPNEAAWKRLPVSQTNFAPTETVLAAIAVEHTASIYVLTANKFHVLSTGDNNWTAAGNREVLFPEIQGLQLYHAISLAVEPFKVIITLVAGTAAYSYTYYGDQDLLVYEGQVDCCGDDWTGPNAPDPYAVRDGWSRLGDPQGWLPGDVQALCNLDEPTPLYAYQLSIGDGFVYPQDIGYCFDFYPPIPFAQFTPFSYPGAPANDLIGGAAWLDGLWIFRGQ